MKAKGSANIASLGTNTVLNKQIRLPGLEIQKLLSPIVNGPYKNPAVSIA